MTVGEKIKYCRERIGITQGKLAELTGIHPVSIRKYETNKMQPQSSQLEKIAAALGVSYNALNGIEHAKMNLETTSDLLGILMVLCDSGILQISGKRQKDYLLIPETVTITFNPLLAPFLEIKAITENEDCALSVKDAVLNIKNSELLEDLLKWEKMSFLLQGAIKVSKENPTKDDQKVIDELYETKEKVELILLKSQKLLDRSNGIGVKIPPDYFG